MALDKTKTDAILGERVNHYLIKMGVQTPTTRNLVFSDASKIEVIEKATREIWEMLGLDLTDDSLQDTPKRIAKMFVNEIYWGLKPDNFPKITTVQAMNTDSGLVLEKNISVKSNCEHHGVPIVGVAHVAYIPNKKILGLSKIPRIVEYFSRRPQIQERLTDQIFHTMCYVLGTDNVAVVIDAQHMCVSMRGVEDSSPNTITSRLGGIFHKGEQRAEFFNLIRA